MKLKEALLYLEKINSSRKNAGEELEICIPICNPGTIGGSPAVAVNSIRLGFDWDQNKIFLDPESELTVLTKEDVSAIRESVSKDQSWHTYQRTEKLYKRIRELELELNYLKNNPNKPWSDYKVTCH